VAELRTFVSAGAPDGWLIAVRSMLDEAFGGDFTEDDWAHSIGGWHVTLTEGDSIVTHAAVVPRTLEVSGRMLRAGYVEGVATKPSREGEGHGSTVMIALAEIVRREFDLGALSTGAHGFYERLGWERWTGPTFVRDDEQVARTENEDDGIMVLRFGVSAGIALTSSVICERRNGDDW
jgi:aminoglycoside 2'-N-acetyltransferase I